MMGRSYKDINGSNPYAKHYSCDSGNFRYIYAANLSTK